MALYGDATTPRAFFWGGGGVGGGLKCLLPYYCGCEFLAILTDLYFLNNLGYV